MPPRLPFSFQARPFSELGLFGPPSVAPSIFPVAGRILLPSFCDPPRLACDPPRLACDPPRLACAPGIACQNLQFSTLGVSSVVHATGRPYPSAVRVPSSAVQFLSRLVNATYPSLVAASPFLPLAGHCWRGSLGGFLRSSVVLLSPTSSVPFPFLLVPPKPPIPLSRLLVLVRTQCRFPRLLPPPVPVPGLLST